MSGASLFLLAVTVAGWYCTGASWLLQVVCYPTYRLVGDREFVPFHVAFGKRMLPVTVIPMVLTCLAMLALLFLRPASTSFVLALLVAACATTVLLTTALFEVPKHLALDRDGRSDALLDGLVRDNLPRTAAWTVASVLLVVMLAQAAA